MFDGDILESAIFDMTIIGEKLVNNNSVVKV